MAKYWIYYARNSTFHMLDKPRCKADVEKLDYVCVAMCESDSGLEHVYAKMQGGIWSPHGEMRELTKSLGVHTSMSILDLVKNEAGEMWMVADMGFEKMEPFSDSGFEK